MYLGGTSEQFSRTLFYCVTVYNKEVAIDNWLSTGK